jgi:hypothetical protein
MSLGVQPLSGVTLREPPPAMVVSALPRRHDFYPALGIARYNNFLPATSSFGVALVYTSLRLHECWGGQGVCPYGNTRERKPEEQHALHAPHDTALREREGGEWQHILAEPSPRRPWGACPQPQLWHVISAHSKDSEIHEHGLNEREHPFLYYIKIITL